MSELAQFSLIALIVSLGLLLAIGSTKLGDVVPIPAPVLFLLAAAVASHVWPALRGGLPILTVERIAIIALVVILLNGGIDIGWQRMRASLGPVLCLGVLGTLLTGAIIAVATHLLIGLDWTLSSIVGAALAATDPAVMFSVLGRREIGGRTGTILEGEAGVNDPAGIALMLGVIEIATHSGSSILIVVKDFALEMGIGVVLGMLGGRLLLALLRRVQLGSERGSIVVIAVNVLEQIDQTPQGLLVVDAAGVVRDAVADPRVKILEVAARTGDTDHWDRQAAPLGHRVQGGKDFLVGEIAGRAEQHERIGRPRAIVGFAQLSASVWPAEDQLGDAAPLAGLVQGSRPHAAARVEVLAARPSLCS